MVRLLLLALAAAGASAQGPLHISGVVPTIAGTAESAPKRSECGVGAMMAWNDVLYYVTYVRSTRAALRPRASPATPNNRAPTTNSSPCPTRETELASIP